MEKTCKSLFIAFALILPLAAVTTMLEGCGTNAPTVAAQADQIVITSVNAGMSVWKDHVNAGKATQSQIDKVHSAYDDYYNAQQVVHAVIVKAIVASTNSVPVTQADITSANVAVTNAETALLALLNQFLNGK